MLGAGAFEAGRGDRMRFSAFDVLYIEGWTLGAAVAAAGLRAKRDADLSAQPRPASARKSRHL